MKDGRTILRGDRIRFSRPAILPAMNDSNAPTVTRFAPSPTGHLHIGGARTALFCYAFARRTGGRFMLRIEDTDLARSSEESTKGILRDLAWLGLVWDDGPTLEIDGATIGGDERNVGPYEQSNRLDLYTEYLDKLVAEGKAYPAFETPAEIAAARDAAQKEKKQYRYDRAALKLSAEEIKAKIDAGEPHVIRFKVPDDEDLVVNDSVLGEVRFAAGETEDFVIRKADGYPTYHFAVVVDDELMGVTHVLRGQEHLNNTPKHVALQKALGFNTPVFAHMPLIFNDKGQKMSKRERDAVAKLACKDAKLDSSPIPQIVEDAAFRGWLKDKKSQLDTEPLEALASALGVTLPEVSVDDFRKGGYLPEVITNFIALLGWTPPKAADGSDVEKFDLSYLCEQFDVVDIGKSNAQFDRTKLLAFNTDVITKLDADDFVARFKAWASEYAPDAIETIPSDKLDLLLRAIQGQCKTFVDAYDRTRFARVSANDLEYDEKGVKKFLLKNEGQGLALLAEFKDDLAKLADFSPEPVHDAMKAFAERKEVGLGAIAQPLRIAMTGTPVSPGIGETLAVVGKDEVMARIERCVRAEFSVSA